MNILFLTSTLPRYDNDSQAPFVLEQALSWKKDRPRDNVYILAPGDPRAKREERIGGITIYRFSYWWPRNQQKLAYPAILPNIRKNSLLLFQLPFFLLNEYLAAKKLIKRHAIGLLYAHWVMPQGWIAYRLHTVLNIDYVLQNHSSDLRVFYRFFRPGRILARNIIINARHLFCVNRRLKEEALEFFDKAGQAQMTDKISVYPMGVYNIPATHLQCGKEEYKYDFGFIGRLTKKKGIEFFIHALQALKKQNISFKAAIAGDGEEKPRLMEMAAGSDIDFLGVVSGEAKVKFFLDTRSIIFPSISSQGDVEGLPVTLLEALTFGRTVAASRMTNVELLPEWEQIKDSIVLLEDPNDIQGLADKLIQILSLDKTEIAARSRILKAAAEKYLWKNLIREYIRRIDEIHSNL